jgi:hypothetical protein
LQLFSKTPFLYWRFFPWTCNPRSKFPNCNWRVLSITVQIIPFFIFNEIYLLHSRLLCALVALLACQINNSSLYFPEFVKMYPKYLGVLLPWISMWFSSFIFCLSFLTLQYSVLKILTSKPHLWYSSTNFFFIDQSNNIFYKK